MKWILFTIVFASLNTAFALTCAVAKRQHANNPTEVSCKNVLDSCSIDAYCDGAKLVNGSSKGGQSTSLSDDDGGKSSDNDDSLD